MINLFLRFTDEDAWRDYALASGVLTQTEQVVDPEAEVPEGEDPITELIDQWAYFTHEYAISNIGIIYNDDGVYDEETGEVITPPTVKPGWHINWKSNTFPPGIVANEIMPIKAHRVWAGDPVTYAERLAARSSTRAVFL